MSHGEESGNPRETLMLMVQFITNEVENNRLGLPDILTAERDVTSPKAIYKEDYAKLPQDVKEKFEQVDRLIALANQAANEEQCEIGKHEKLINEIDDTDLERQYAKEKERLNAILEAEKIAEQIMEAGTIWRYENKLAPGEVEKRNMTHDMVAKLTDNLTAHIEELDNAGLENDISKLKEEISSAREFVLSLKMNLAAYNNTARLEKVIRDVEQTIEMSEAQVSRLQKTPSRTQYQDGRPLSSSESTKTFGKNTGDFLDAVLREKRIKSHQPLTATPAGTHTIVSSMEMLSTKPRQENNSNGRKPHDDGDNRDFPS